jgi:hypothetical protein
MTETEWLASTDPGEMADFVRDRLGDRKFRLFGCACVRLVWKDLPNDTLRQAIETCERFADGVATVEELAMAREVADGTYQGIGDIIADHSAIAVTALCELEPWFPMGEGSSAGIAAVAAEAWSNEEIPWHVAWAQAKEAHCQLLRDIFGNPFRSVAVDPSWRAWDGGTVVKLAQRIYDERAFDRLPVLADALEEAGCSDPYILNHCRQSGEHVRGCWAVDALLGKS